MTLKAEAQKKIIFRHFTIESGLASNSISGIQWDAKTDFLWIATDRGIIRYNGIVFKLFNSISTPFLSSNKILSLVKSNKHIYAINESNEIISIDSNTLSLAYKGKTAELAKKELLRLTLPEKLYNTIKNKHSVLDKSEILPISDTSLYVLNSAGGKKIDYFTAYRHETAILPITNISSVFVLNNQCFLFNAKKSISSINSASKKINPIAVLQEDGSELNFAEKQNSICYESGLPTKPILISGSNAYLLYFKKNKIITRLICSSVPQNISISYIQYDEKKKMLCIGTSTDGLFIIKENMPNSVNGKLIKESASLDTDYSQAALVNGNIFTNNDDLIELPDQISKSIPFHGKILSNLCVSVDGLLWFVIDGKLLNYNFISHKTKAFKQAQNISDHFSLVRSRNKIFLSTDTGIGVLQNDSICYLHKWDLKYSSDFSTISIKELFPGVLVIATPFAILRFNTTTLKLDTLLKTTDANYVKSLFIYKGYLFMGTYGKGYYIHKNGKTKVMPLDRNKSLLYTHCFTVDEKGFCWMCTNNGIFKAKMNDILSAFDYDMQQIYYHCFSRKDAINAHEMSGGCLPCTAVTLKNGKLISVPITDNLLWANLADTALVVPDGNVYIDEMSVNGIKRNIDFSRPVKIGAPIKKLSFYLGFPAWCKTENIYLQYKLNPLSDKWRDVLDNDTAIEFSNLPAGNYMLEIRKLKGFGNDNYSYRKINFSISQVWYKQTWCLIIRFILIIALCVAVFLLMKRYYKKRKIEVVRVIKEKIERKKVLLLKEKKEDELKFVSTLSHDIIAPLNFLSITSKMLLNQSETLMENPLGKTAIKEIANMSNDLGHLATNLINWMKWENSNTLPQKEVINLYGIVKDTLLILTPFIKNRKNININNIDKTKTIVGYPEPIKIILYNLIMNAIKYTESGFVLIYAYDTTEKTVVVIEDRGMGMTEQQIESILNRSFFVDSPNNVQNGNGFGYRIINGLLKKTGATMQIKSDKNGGGTSVSVFFDYEFH